MAMTTRVRPVPQVVRAVFALSVMATVLVRPGLGSGRDDLWLVERAHHLRDGLGHDSDRTRVLVTVTNSPNSGPVFSTWAPPGPSVFLMEQDGPSPQTGNYSFLWPTEKYRDAIGSLQIRPELNTATPVVLSGITLANGNTSDIQHTPNNWQSFLPGAWTQPTDATILAVGDGPDGLATSNGVASSIAAADPPLFLFLGDIYARGTFTENLNYYGESSMDVSGGGTLWGAFAGVTQPTLGNHEKPYLLDWTDYWHQRPTFTAFTFGGVLFIDLDSNASFAVGSQQYQFAQNLLGHSAALRRRLPASPHLQEQRSTTPTCSLFGRS